VAVTEPARARRDARLRLASYNVRRCIGTDRRHDVARVLEVLRELDADVVGLQEIAVRRPLRGGVDQLEELAAAAGYTAVPAPIRRTPEGYLGNGLLVRGRVAEARHIDLTRPGREPRGALDTLLECQGRLLRVVVTHLGLWPGERRAQVTRLLHVLGERPAHPTVVLGDFNEWLPRAPLLRRLAVRLGATPAVPSFPSRRPVLKLDRIWVDPRAALRALGVHRSALARLASDHLPVWATLELAPLALLLDHD
jgi:endonuclease/exonuclease/phosphatase family metal-dependent hydrolase